MLEEVTNDIKSMSTSLKKGLGKNGYALLLAGGAVVALIIILRSNKEDETDDYTVPTGVASYPDAGENADVIISSIGSSIDYAQDEIIDSIGETIKDSAEDIKENTQNPMYKDITTEDGGMSYQIPQEVTSSKTDVWSSGEVLNIFKNNEPLLMDEMNKAKSGMTGRSTFHSDFITNATNASNSFYDMANSTTGGGIMTGTSARGSVKKDSISLTRSSALASGTMKAVKDKSNVNPKTGHKTASKTTPKTSKSTGVRSRKFDSATTKVKSMDSTPKISSGNSHKSSGSKSSGSKSSGSKSSGSKSSKKKK